MKRKYRWSVYKFSQGNIRFGQPLPPMPGHVVSLNCIAAFFNQNSEIIQLKASQWKSRTMRKLTVRRWKSSVERILFHQGFMPKHVSRKKRKLKNMTSRNKLPNWTIYCHEGEKPWIEIYYPVYNRWNKDLMIRRDRFTYINYNSLNISTGTIRVFWSIKICCEFNNRHAKLMEMKEIVLYLLSEI